MGDLINYGKEQIKRAAQEFVKGFIKKNPYIIAIIAGVAFAILILFAILGAAGSAEAAERGTIPANSDYIVKTDETNSAPVITDIEQLKEAFSGYPTNSKLIENAQAFLDMQETYKVNAIFAAAVAIDETTAGTAGNGSNGNHNWFNYSHANGMTANTTGHTGDTPYCTWDTDEHGILGFGYYIANGSIGFKSNNYSVTEIGEAGYCTEPPHPEWANNVKGFMTDMYEAAGIVINNTGGEEGEMSKGTEIVGTFTSSITGRTFTIINQNVLQNTRGSNWSYYCNRAVSVCIASAYSNKDISTMINEAYNWSNGLPMSNNYWNQYGLKYDDKTSNASNYQTYFKDALNSGKYLAIRFNSAYTSNSGVTWTNSGHWVAVIGFKTENGIDMMYIADSTTRYNSGWYKLSEFTNCNCLQYIIEISEK